MSLKENVDYVKQELNTEEKFLESFVKVERFYKKYKILILSLVAILVIGSISYVVKQNVDENNKIKANIAFDKIIKNPNDTQALKTLEESNKKLYDIALFLKAKKENKQSDINVKFLKELSLYSKAVENKNIEQLSNISLESNFLLKEFALLNKAIFQAQKNEITKAKETLKLIPNTSKANELSSLLLHYLNTK